MDNFTFVSHPKQEVPHTWATSVAGLTVRWTQRVDVLEDGKFLRAEVHEFWHDHNDRLQRVTTKDL